MMPSPVFPILQPQVYTFEGLIVDVVALVCLVEHMIFHTTERIMARATAPPAAAVPAMYPLSWSDVGGEEGHGERGGEGGDEGGWGAA